jgi:hypothetical protein
VSLHIITAVTRPENLERISDSIAQALVNWPDGTAVEWHLRYDLERQHVGGQALKNAMLDEIRDGWCWVLDDDTLAHPDVFRVVTRAIDRHPTRAVIVSQQRTDGRVLQAVPEHMVPGMVDIGQAFLRRDLIGDDRIPIDYNGDGMFLQTVLAKTRPTYLPDVVSLHNALSGVEVSV